MRSTTPILRGLCLGLALPLAATQPVAIADSLDIPAIEVPGFEVPSFEIPRIEVPAISIPSIHLDLDALNTQLASLNIDLDDLDIDLEDITRQLETIDFTALEDIAIAFENGAVGLGNDPAAVMQRLERQRARQMGDLSVNNPSVSRQLEVWDKAIGQVHQALTKAPGDPQLMALLEQLYQQQFDYLEQLAKADPLATDYY